MKILRETQVICTTTIAAGADFLSKFQFEAVLIDEVAQATELSAMVPVVLRGAKRIVLVGDHCQLPPAVLSSEAEMRGLSLSVYSRLSQAGGIKPFLLNTQYRSHPKLAEFSSNAFYDGRLKSGVEADKRQPPKGIKWPNPDCPVAFINVDAQEEAEGDSKANSIEAQMIADIVRNVLHSKELKVSEVGVVTPYMAQVRRLRQLLRPVLPPGADPRLLECASVDNFQGREKELIVFSAVRSNKAGNVGFLADWRRLNVMITRARRGLVVVGNAETLRSDHIWGHWLDFAEKQKCLIMDMPMPEVQNMFSPQVIAPPPPKQPNGIRGSTAVAGGALTSKRDVAQPPGSTQRPLNPPPPPPPPPAVRPPGVQHVWPQPGQQAPLPEQNWQQWEAGPPQQQWNQNGPAVGWDAPWPSHGHAAAPPHQSAQQVWQQPWPQQQQQQWSSPPPHQPLHQPQLVQPPTEAQPQQVLHAPQLQQQHTQVAPAQPGSDISANEHLQHQTARLLHLLQGAPSLQPQHDLQPQPQQPSQPLGAQLPGQAPQVPGLGQVTIQNQQYHQQQVGAQFHHTSEHYPQQHALFAGVPMNGAVPGATQPSQAHAWTQAQQWQEHGAWSNTGWQQPGDPQAHPHQQQQQTAQWHQPQGWHQW